MIYNPYRESQQKTFSDDFHLRSFHRNNLGRRYQFTAGDEGTLSTTSHPAHLFLTFVTFYSSSDWSRARSFAKVKDKKAARSSFVTYCWLTTLCDAFRVLSTTTVLRDVLIVALGVPVVVVLTHTSLVNVESTPRRLLMRRWLTSKLTDVSMKIQLQIMRQRPF